jgi:hypothetical protein
MTTETLERHRVLELSRQVDEAADQLWATGQLTLVLRLLCEDAQRLVNVLRDSDRVEPADVSSLERLCQRGVDLGLPQLEQDLTPAHRELLGRLASCRRRCVRNLLAADSGTQRLRRRLAVVLALGALGVAAYLMFRNLSVASASGVYSSDFPASQAIDGLQTTEWLLPHQQSGWLEIAFTRPRDMSKVRLLNAVNSHYRDRASKTVKVEAYRRTQLVATARAEFPAIDGKQREPVSVGLSAADVTHLRITIESFHGGGGGLAEVEVE